MNPGAALAAMAADAQAVCEYCGEPLKTTSVVVNGRRIGGLPCYASCGCQRSVERYQSVGGRRVESPLARYRRAGVPERFLSAETNVTAQARDFEEGQWLYIYGGFGEGKTKMASCIAKTMIDLGSSVRFESTSMLVDERFRNPEIVERLIRCEYLFLDDLGKEANSEYAVGFMFEVIDQRYRAAKPTCVTSNYSIG